jgi:hypothetical protein
MLDLTLDQAGLPPTAFKAPDAFLTGRAAVLYRVADAALVYRAFPKDRSFELPKGAPGAEVAAVVSAVLAATETATDTMGTILAGEVEELRAFAPIGLVPGSQWLRPLFE